MRVFEIVLPFAAIGLAGCAATVAHEGREQLKAECAAKGRQFLETSVKEVELVVAENVEIRGECVGPGDPGYVRPSNPPQ